MVESKAKHRKRQPEHPKKTVCVLGPSFVGKTQIVNRIVNNAFFPQYHMTEEKDVYTMLYNKNKGQSGSKPEYVQIEIWDCFPQDHPLLFTD